MARVHSTGLSNSIGNVFRTQAYCSASCLILSAKRLPFMPHTRIGRRLCLEGDGVPGSRNGGETWGTPFPGTSVHSKRFWQALPILLGCIAVLAGEVWAQTGSANAPTAGENPATIDQAWQKASAKYN